MTRASAGAPVIWLTGLSSAGKTTIARAVSAGLRKRGLEVEWLDGDLVRERLGRGLGFSRADRDENARRIAYVAGLLARHGVIVVVSAISPYREVRSEIRRGLASTGRLSRTAPPGFIEVYVNAPLATCERRDVKGLYRRARVGEIHQFTGVSDPYEPPLAPEVVCYTEKESVRESSRKVLAAILPAARRVQTRRGNSEASEAERPPVAGSPTAAINAGAPSASAPAGNSAA